MRPSAEREHAMLRLWRWFSEHVLGDVRLMITSVVTALAYAVGILFAYVGGQLYMKGDGLFIPALSCLLGLTVIVLTARWGGRPAPGDSGP